LGAQVDAKFRELIDLGRREASDFPEWVEWSTFGDGVVRKLRNIVFLQTGDKVRFILGRVITIFSINFDGANWLDQLSVAIISFIEDRQVIFVDWETRLVYFSVSVYLIASFSRYFKFVGVSVLDAF
jgi:hypothetical protein